MAYRQRLSRSTFGDRKISVWIKFVGVVINCRIASNCICVCHYNESVDVHTINGKYKILDSEGSEETFLPISENLVISPYGIIL